MSWDKIMSGIAGAAGAVLGLWGEWTAAMTVLLTLMCVDYVTGCLCALMGKSEKTPGGHWLSSAAFKGLMHKFLIMLILLVATQLDKVVTVGSATFQTMCTFYYISCEGLSIVENVGLLGFVPLPKFLRNALEVLRDKNDDVPDEPDKKE